MKSRSSVLALHFALALAGSVALVPGCKASVNADLKTGEEVADFDKPMDPSQFASANDEAPKDAALLGARTDLSFKGTATPKCQCLAVAVGQPSDAAFGWASKMPVIDTASQLVVSVSSTGVSCSATTNPGASYWGYEVVGDDVIVVVENHVAGRPLTTGAIVPRPLGNGRLLVRPASKSVPYGRALDGAERCVTGNLPVLAKSSGSTGAEPFTSSGTRIRTEEADPTSTRVDLP